MAKPNPEVDAEWIRTVVAQFERPLVMYALRLIGDLERARDVVQDAFLKLCREPRSKIEPYLAEWLYTVCRNRSLDVCRKESRVVRLAEGQLGVKVDLDADPSSSMEQRETKALVLTMVGELPEKQQEAIRLKFQHGLSYRQISKVMELTTSYVGYLIHAGLKTIRERMVDEETREDIGPVARIPGPSRTPPLPPPPRGNVGSGR
ncbi:MAG: sigma-70 family RNA polymerase sigma factor [Phycisphaeraceae bacterium]